MVITIRIKDLDPRIENKYKKMKEKKELNKYLSELIVNYELGLLGDNPKDESLDLLKRVELLEKKIEEITKNGVFSLGENTEVESTIEGNLKTCGFGYSQEAEDFLKNMLEI